MVLLVQVSRFGTDTRYGLDILQQVEKELKLKVRKFWEPIPAFVEVTGENW